jgi:hypothetical protein
MKLFTLLGNSAPCCQAMDAQTLRQQSQHDLNSNWQRQQRASNQEAA